jgi:polyisoprenoid-binding protein YceI
MIPTSTRRCTRTLGRALGRIAAATTLACAMAGHAAPVTYQIDPHHTYPSFEADHMGISLWRGKITQTAGTVVYDKADGSGTVDIQIDMRSLDFGHRPMNAWAQGKDFLNLKAAKDSKDAKGRRYAQFKGRFAAPVGGVPSKLEGELRLNGITKPVTLTINLLKCLPHPMFKRELCGADAVGSFRRDEFDLAAGKDYGFNMEVALRIQVEAIAQP